jgi:hypothetical protein
VYSEKRGLTHANPQRATAGGDKPASQLYGMNTRQSYGDLMIAVDELCKCDMIHPSTQQTGEQYETHQH